MSADNASHSTRWGSFRTLSERLDDLDTHVSDGNTAKEVQITNRWPTTVWIDLDTNPATFDHATFGVKVDEQNPQPVDLNGVLTRDEVIAVIQGAVEWVTVTPNGFSADSLGITSNQYDDDSRIEITDANTEAQNHGFTDQVQAAGGFVMSSTFQGPAGDTVTLQDFFYWWFD